MAHGHNLYLDHSGMCTDRQYCYKGQLRYFGQKLGAVNAYVIIMIY